MNVKTITENANKSGASCIASMTLAYLRRLRDNHPTEWDALIKADKENVLVKLWDYLRENQL